MELETGKKGSQIPLLIGGIAVVALAALLGGGQKSSCPAGDVQGTITCPTGYEPDPNAPGCCRPIIVNRGNTVIRFRPSTGSRWTLPAYSPETIIGYIADLKPHWLNRYHNSDVPSDATQLLNNIDTDISTSTSNPKLTWKEFLQASLNACNSPDSTSLYPRYSMNAFYTNQNAWFQGAQDLLSIGRSLSPPQTGIGLDNETAINHYSDAKTICSRLHSMGYTYVCFGAQGNKFVNSWVNGDVDFVMLGVNTSTWQPNNQLITYWSKFPSIKNIIVQIDPPGEMLPFSNLTNFEEQTIITNLFAGQSTPAQHKFMPLFVQGQFDFIRKGLYDFLKAQLASSI